MNAPRREPRRRNADLERIGRFLRRLGRIHMPSPYGGFRWVAAAALLLFCIQCFTGVLLALHYQPDPAAAWHLARRRHEDTASEERSSEGDL